MDHDTEHRVRERAYQIWEQEGRPHGRDAHHWQRAAAEFADAGQKKVRGAAKPDPREARSAGAPEASAAKPVRGREIDAPGSAPSKRPNANAAAPSARKPRRGKPTAGK